MLYPEITYQQNLPNQFEKRDAGISCMLTVTERKSMLYDSI